MHDDPLYDDDLLDSSPPQDAEGDLESYLNAPKSRADEILDELMPEGFEWRRVVITYPRVALAASLVGGFFIGRTQGLGLLAGISGFFVGEVTRNVQGFVDDLTGS
ncbi:MAG: hypothetical protein AAF725_23980 [Acidobacteriota bacterium]